MFSAAKLIAQKIPESCVAFVATTSLCVLVKFAQPFYCVRIVQRGIFIAVCITVAVHGRRTLQVTHSVTFFTA